MLKIRNFDVAAGQGYIDFWHFDVAAGHGYIDFAGIKDLDSEPLSFPKRHKENVVFGCQLKRAWTGYIDFFFVLRSMYPWGRATLKTPQRRVWELISNLNVRFHFNLQVIRQGKVNVALGLGYIDFKTKFWKNINVAHSGSFESYDFLCDHLWLVSHPILCLPDGSNSAQISFWPEAMALQPWIQKVKKNEKEEAKGPPQKMLCTPYEKQLKKMPGDLTMLKDISVWWSVIYFSINLATPQKAPASPSRMCFWPHFWDSSWTGGATPKCFAFLLLSLLDGFPCKSNLKHRHVLDSLVLHSMQEVLHSMQLLKADTAVFEGELHPGDAVCTALSGSNHEVSVANAMALQSWFQEYAQMRASKGRQVAFKEISSFATVIIFRIFDNLWCVILLFTFFQGRALTDSQTPSPATTA